MRSSNSSISPRPGLYDHQYKGFEPQSNHDNYLTFTTGASDINTTLTTTGTSTSYLASDLAGDYGP